MQELLALKNISLSRTGTPVVSTISFVIHAGEILLLTGGNGAGKSTLAQAIMGFKGPELIAGDMLYLGESIDGVPTHERARRGIFLAHQELPAIPGVSAVDVLRASAEALNPEGFSISHFYTKLREALEILGLTLDFAKKEMNVAFSGGEKKKIELLSLLMTKPKLAILDEIDAGMDAETRQKLLSVIKSLQAEGTGFLIISHQGDLYANLENTRSLSL